MDGRLEEELKAINKRIETMLDIVLEHFGDSEDRFDELEKMIYKKEDMSEDTVEEKVSEDEKVEMSKDMVTSLVEEIEHLKTKLSEMEETPGAEGFTHNPETKTKSNSKVDLAKMTASERAAYYINNK